jgi:hypothetical protein
VVLLSERFGEACRPVVIPSTSQPVYVGRHTPQLYWALNGCYLCSARQLEFRSTVCESSLECIAASVPVLLQVRRTGKNASTLLRFSTSLHEEIGPDWLTLRLFDTIYVVGDRTVPLRVAICPPLGKVQSIAEIVEHTQRAIRDGQIATPKSRFVDRMCSPIGGSTAIAADSLIQCEEETTSRKRERNTPEATPSLSQEIVVRSSITPSKNSDHSHRRSSRRMARRVPQHDSQMTVSTQESSLDERWDEALQQLEARSKTLRGPIRRCSNSPPQTLSRHITRLVAMQRIAAGEPRRPAESQVVCFDHSNY